MPKRSRRGSGTPSHRDIIPLPDSDKKSFDTIAPEGGDRCSSMKMTVKTAIYSPRKMNKIQYLSGAGNAIKRDGSGKASDYPHIMAHRRCSTRQPVLIRKHKRHFPTEVTHAERARSRRQSSSNGSRDRGLPQPNLAILATERYRAAGAESTAIAAPVTHRREPAYRNRSAYGRQLRQVPARNEFRRCHATTKGL